MRKPLSVSALFVCCWCTYLAAYLCRVNFSTALTALSESLRTPVERLGTVGASFFAVYAVGQLLNGFLGDRMRPALFLSIALAGTALCNVIVAMSRSFAAVLLCWSLNGYFQSIFWSTIIRLLALNIPAEKRAAVSAGISTSIVAGYILSWSVFGELFAGLPATPYFAVPAACALLLVVVWQLLRHRLNTAPMHRSAPRGVRETVRFIAQNGLVPVLPLCMFHGLIKESVSFWLPLLLTDLLPDTGVPRGVLLALVPLANMAGMYLSRWMLGRRNPHPGMVLALCCLLSVLASGALCIVRSPLATVALIACVSSLAYAANTVLMSFWPMQYAGENMVASLAGVFDFAAYVGAALSTYGLSLVLSRHGFGPVPVIWTAAALAAMVLGLVAGRKRNASTA